MLRIRLLGNVTPIHLLPFLASYDCIEEDHIAIHYSITQEEKDHLKQKTDTILGACVKIIMMV